MSNAKPTGYVVYGCEHLRDGREEWARCFDTLAGAMRFLNEDFHGKCNTTMRLFELGREIPLGTETVEEPQPAKTTTRIVLKGGVDA